MVVERNVEREEGSAGVFGAVNESVPVGVPRATSLALCQVRKHIAFVTYNFTRAPSMQAGRTKGFYVLRHRKFI
jgi:hypothetical protein